jgi:hypothetical protein
MPPLARPGELPTVPLDWSLEKTGADLCLADAKLVQPYCIFGASGSGKTHLMRHLLRQAFAHCPDDPERRFGGLILDPKAATIDTIQDIMDEAGRDKDKELVILENGELEKNGSVNIIDCALDPFELAAALVLAGQSAGAAATEPFWFGSWKNLFTGTVPLLDWLAEEPLTLRLITQNVLLGQTGPDGRFEAPIQELARQAAYHLDDLDDGPRADMELAISLIEKFFAQDPKERGVVQSLITTAYGGFLRSRWAAYSGGNSSRTQERSLYDSIIEDGKVVLVSVSPFDTDMAKVICTVVKCLFQKTVLGRLARHRSGQLTNYVRPLLLACDEYSDVASEVPGQAMGDAHFFANARQYGCMSLMATQSISRLEASSLKETWRAVVSSFAGGRSSCGWPTTKVPKRLPNSPARSIGISHHLVPPSRKTVRARVLIKSYASESPCQAPSSPRCWRPVRGSSSARSTEAPDQSRALSSSRCQMPDIDLGYAATADDGRDQRAITETGQAGLAASLQERQQRAVTSQYPREQAQLQERLNRLSDALGDGVDPQQMEVFRHGQMDQLRERQDGVRQLYEAAQSALPS